MSGSIVSYAQAAKGRTPAPTSSTLPAADSHTKDPHTKEDASPVTTVPEPSVKTFSTASTATEKSAQIEADLDSKKSDTNGGPASTLSDSNVVPAKNEVTIPQDTTTKPSTHSTNDSSVRPSNRSSEPTDSRKSRKSKKAKSSEKDAENEQAAAEALEKEKAKKDLANLVESAPPKVNIWQQRAEANAKPKKPSLGSIMAAAESKTKPALELSTKSSNNAEATESHRGSIKAGEASRVSNDQIARKTRGTRAIEKGDQTPVPSSAVEDVTSWPTPQTISAEDEKRKAAMEPDPKEKQDNGTKGSRTSSKHWEKLAFEPSVVFNTQIPRNTPKPRGNGQAGRGSGRGHSASISLGAEKAMNASHDVLSSKEGIESQGRLREDARAPFPSSEKSKKFNNADQHSRKQSVPEPLKGPRGSGPSEFGPKNDNVKTVNGNEPTAKKDNFNGHNNPKPKRAGAHANGRGAHSGQQQPYNANGNGSARVNNHSPPAYGAAYNPQFPNGRGRGRAGPGSNGFKGPTNGMGKVHPQQPQGSGFEYGHFPGYAQPPFQPAPPKPQEHFVKNVLRQQIGYYFSEENLFGDVYLKRQMDAQGFVPFAVIAGFRRVQNAADGNLKLIKDAALEVSSIEYVVADNGEELLRRRGDWEKFVFPDARPGPTQLSPVTNPSQVPPPSGYYQPMPYPAQFDPMSSQYMPGYPVPDVHMGHPGYMHRHQFSSNDAHMNQHIPSDNPALNVSALPFSPIQPATNGFNGAYAQPSWGEQAGQQPETTHSTEGLPLNQPDSDNIPNGIAEPVTPTKTNGIHATSEPPAV